MLKQMAETFIRWLDSGTTNFPVETQRIAENEKLWPVLLGVRKTQQKHVSDRLAALGLSRKLVADVTKKGADPKTAVNAFAGCLIDYVDRLRLIKLRRPFLYRKLGSGQAVSLPQELFNKVQALDPLSQDNVDVWFDVSWQVLCFFTNDEPQAYAELEEFGEFRVTEAESRKRSVISDKARENLLKDGIRKRLNQAFTTIAKERG